MFAVVQTTGNALGVHLNLAFYSIASNQ